jgi:hypothetical protein
MLSPRDQFKIKVLEHCANQGWVGQELEQRLCKAAEWASKQAETPWYGKPVEMASDVVGKFLKGPVEQIGSSILPLGLGAAFGIPAAAGAAIGGGAAHMLNSSDTDVAEIKKRTLIDEYVRAAEQAKLQTLLHERIGNRPRPRPML